MALPVTIPNEFANATASIPLSQLDTNFTTLANAVNGISDGSETLANASVTVLTAGTANVTTLNTSGQVVFNDAGADVDFRVEGDTEANLLFVDASAESVGINAPTPRGRLHIGGDLSSGATDAAAINLKQTSTTAATGIYLERSGERKGYYIYLGSGNDGLGFQRNNAGTKSDVMTLDRDGLVGIGTSAPSSLGKLSVDGNFVFGPFTRNEADTRSIGIFTSDDPASNDRAAIGFTTTAGGSSSNSIITFSTNDYGVSGGERMRIDSSGNLLVNKTSGTTNVIAITAGTQGTQILAITDNGTQQGAAAFFNCTNGGENGAACAMTVKANSGTSRSINAGGTVNASGTDYAEYMTKAGNFTIAKGDICGVNANGNLTNVFADAVAFLVKSTNPSYVGGDSWGNDQAIGDKPEKPSQRAAEVDEENNEAQAAETDEDFAARQAQYETDLAEFEAKLEAERQKVDRIAFSGQVPVNVTGATAGQYIVPVENNGGITGVAVDEADMTLAQYMKAVGKVIAIEEDGRARIIVKVA
jgi:hypothetical protein